MLFKKLLMPCGLCAVPIANPVNASSDKMSTVGEAKAKNLIRPSELPIYSFEDDYPKQAPCKECPPSALEQNISKIRKSVQAVVSEYKHYTGVLTDTVDIGIEHSRSMVDYLREESNFMPRMGAIGIGGLAGLILGLRGRTFKRVVYTSTGALAVAALCYPKKAEEGVEAARHYIRIGYNFIYGVRPGDNRQLELPELPKLQIPTSFSEFANLAAETASTVTTAVGSFAQNAYASLGADKEGKPPAAKSDTKQD